MEQLNLPQAELARPGEVALALSAYAAQDRRRAGAAGVALPARSLGAVLFVDISGFTPLTERLALELGRRRGADALTRLLNSVYTALIAAIEREAGSVIGFSGDALTCWFAGEEGASAPRVAAAHAFAAAAAVQLAMAPFAQVEAAPGVAASLAVKCALAAGPVTRALVGDPNVQLLDVVAGAPVDRMAAAEQLARAGEILADAATVEALGGAAQVIEWRASNGERYAALELPVAAPQPPQADELPAIAGAQAWVHAPVAESIRSGHERFLAELRPAVALFVRFEGIDWERSGAAAALLDQWMRWAQAVVAAHEGLVIQLTTGDKGSYFYAAFGAPIAHEDERARALRCAAQLMRPPAELSAIRDVCCGISTGLMRVGAYGGPTRRTYGVLGAEVNRAARLMMLAAPGQLLASQAVADTLGAAAGLTLLPHGVASLKGSSAPAPIYRLAEGQAATPHVRSHYPPPVGRDAELQQLRAAWQAATKGHGLLVRIEGAPGVGKSHLLAEAVRRAQLDGVQVAFTTCLSQAQQSPYSGARPLVQQLLALPEAESAHDSRAALAQAVATLLPRAAERLPLLGDLLGIPLPETTLTASLDARLRQQATAAFIAELVLARAAQFPWLLVVEDAHWLDELSHALLAALAPALRDARACLLLAHRPRPTGLPLLDDAPPLATVDLALGELSADAGAALVERRLGAPAAPLVRDLLHGLAQGNPFYLEELTDTLVDTGRIEKRGGSWRASAATVNALRAARCLRAGDEPELLPGAPLGDAELGLPTSVQGVVLARLDRLPAPARLTLKVASVFGRSFELPLLERVPTLQEASVGGGVRHAILHALDRDFVRRQPGEVGAGSEEYQFKHNITREVAYSTLLEEQQQELHLAVGELLEAQRPGDVEELAHHFSRANTAQPAVRARALLWLEAAAERAAHDYANETALAWLERALALESRPSLLRTRVQVLHVLARREQQRETLATLDAATNTGTDAGIGSTALLWSDYHEAVGDFAAAGAALASARTAAQDAVATAAVDVRMGMVAWRQGDYTGAEACFNAALAQLPAADDADAASLPGAGERAAAHYGLGLVLRQQGRFDEAATHYRRDLALNAQLGNRVREARAHFALGTLESMRRNFAGALPWYEHALAMRRTIGDRAGVGAGLLALAQTRGSLGDHAAALPLLTEALQIQQAIHNRWEEWLIWNELGILRMMIGDYDAAAQAFEAGLACSRAIESEQGVAYLLCNLGQVQRDQGQLAAAEQTLCDGLALAVAQEDRGLEAVYCVDLALTLALAARPAEAVEMAERAIALNVQQEQEGALPALYALLGQVAQQQGDCATALAHARRAVGLLDASGGAEADFPQRDYWSCAQTLLACGAEAEAAAARAAALRHLNEKAARISDPTVRAAFLTNIPTHRQILDPPATDSTQGR